MLVEREDFDVSGAIVRTVYVRPTQTQRGWQYKVGPGSYTVNGAELIFNSLQSCVLLPQSYSSFD